ncbi:YeeE/YedE family protein [Ramlibacter rhizophilus]|uniref:YeeE/YedE family protein n=1 Tax=Ramlibacter rhizophilus TaxID=1781167 RepID=A0A4Z0BZG9_9BURK|nr:YeeE/YedE family protein [Ramlibacter rhizophilus]TFZ04371.1 YeeE/YedE family protein [Ramlibacter rhizophilus]
MSPDASLATLTQYVLWGGLLIGVVFGAVSQSTRFCVRGAIADWVIFRGPARLVAWFVAVAVGAVCVQLLIASGSFDASRTLAWSDRLLWASALFGGLLFGYGMILCGGCPQRSLVKAGQGNMKSVLTLLVVAIAALMTLRGLLASLRVSVFDRWSVQLSGPQDLGHVLSSALGLSAGSLRWLLTLLIVAVVAAFAWRVRRSLDAGTVIGGALVGLLLGAALVLTGHIGFIAEHPETLESAWLGTQSRRPEGLSFAAPMGHLLDLVTMWTDQSTVLSFGVAVVLGVLGGSFASARLRGDFRWEMFASPREFGEHLLGGVLMGFGGVTALGCSVGNGVTGLALLSSGAVLAVIGIVAGARAALWVQDRHSQRADKHATASTQLA